MAERYSNYPYRYNQTNLLFSSVAPLLQGYLENKRNERQMEQLYKEQEKVLRLNNPNISDIDAQKYSRVNRGSFSQILRSMEEGEAQKSRQSLAGRLGIDTTQLEGLSPQDQSIYINQMLQQQQLGEREKRQLAAEQRQEKRAEERYFKRQLIDSERMRLEAEGYSPKQAIKFARKGVNGEAPKGLTSQLKQLFALRSEYLNGKLTDVDVALKVDKPEQIALITGKSADETTQDKVMELLQSSAVQRLAQRAGWEKKSDIEKESELLNMTRNMAMPFGYKFDKVPKPTKDQIRISRQQEAARKQAELEKIEKEKRKKQLAWEVAWQTFGRGS